MTREELTLKIKRSIIGKEIWAFSGGAGTYFHLHIGNMIHRKKEINNPNLDEDLRKFIGEYIVDVYSDDWKVNLSSIEIISSSSDDLQDMIPEFRKLKNSTIDSVSISAQNDLKLTLSNAFELNVKCSNDNHWDYFDQHNHYSVFIDRIDVE